MEGKDFKDFVINIYSLTNKVHEYRFSISEGFFDMFEQSIIEGGKGSCDLKITRTETVMTFDFSLNASVQLICDLSLKSFDYPINVEKSILVKFGEEDAELSEEVIVIQKDKQQINVADYIYQFILLEVPMKKLHPDYDDSDRPDLVFVSEAEGPKEEEKEEIDPRWEALKNLNKEN